LKYYNETLRANARLSPESACADSKPPSTRIVVSNKLISSCSPAVRCHEDSHTTAVLLTELQVRLDPSASALKLVGHVHQQQRVYPSKTRCQPERACCTFQSPRASIIVSAMPDLPKLCAAMGYHERMRGSLTCCPDLETGFSSSRPKANLKRTTSDLFKTAKQKRGTHCSYPFE